MNGWMCRSISSAENACSCFSSRVQKNPPFVLSLSKHKRTPTPLNHDLVLLLGLLLQHPFPRQHLNHFAHRPAVLTPFGEALGQPEPARCGEGLLRAPRHDGREADVFQGLG